MIEQIELDEIFIVTRFKDFIRHNELLELHEKYGPIDFYRLQLAITEENYDRWNDIIFTKRNRRGEVALCVRNHQKRILLHTKPFYPSDTFRIPTGGIHYDENATDALYRELDEETGFRPKTFQLPAFLIYEFHHQQQVIPFMSYIFDVEVGCGDPQPKDQHENISGYRWSARSQLPDVITHLKSFKERKWREWGLMRAAPHEILDAMLDQTE